MKNFSTLISALLICQASVNSALAADVSNKDFEQLKQQMEKQATTIASLNEKLEMTAEMIDQSASSKPVSKTTIGGYGELHYNNLKNKKSGEDDKKEIDFHRAILFVGHDFNDTIRFWSELEIEHSQAGDGKSGGEVSMEQAYVEFDIGKRLSIRSGIFLVPAGIVNETHEPPTFYGVERNPVEKNIIPTTWREGGVAVTGRLFKAFTIDAAIHSGLETDSASTYAVRSGRNSVRKANAEDLAFTTRFKWSGIAGLELAATLQYQTDVTQSADATAGSALLTEAHMVWNKGPFGLRALYANWMLDGRGPESIGADKQSGWYVEPSFRISEAFGLFTRYNQWDNTAGDSSDSKYSQIDFGINYWPHPQVVVKADYQLQSTPSGKNDYDGVNLGIGYQF